MTIEPTDIVVVVTALESEYAAVRDLLEEPAVRRHAAGTRFEVGTIRGGTGRVALALAGAGNQPAAVVAERAIAEFRPRAVFFAGIAGALHDDLDLGSVVVATKVYGYHGGFEGGEGFGARPQAWDADHELEQIARSVSRDGRWRFPAAPRVVFRPVAAGEVVLDSPFAPSAQQLRQHYSDAAAVELESAGTAKAAHLNRAPFLTVRAISDRADGRKHESDRAGWQSIAAGNAAAFTIAVVTELFASAPSLPALGSSAVTWQRPVELSWRTDLTGTTSAVERCAVEVHLVPMDEYGRLEAHVLERMHELLTAHGRTHGLFSGTERLSAEVSADAAWVRSAPSPDGHRGLAVHRTGQRCAWSPLQYNAHGSVVDRTALGRQVERSLRLLAELSGLPAPAAVAVAAGLEPAAGLTENRAGQLPGAGGSCTAARIRVHSGGAVPFHALLARPQEAADELTARLHQAFRQAC
ncbi:5'-methylthioadenosine/S-adenosylhomocysteine nucleosidase [Nocardia sp. NRRL S-836]|uniref:5'-methylthioadenosine/S-adenosylhomocysteine nucleosidase family protein n=1 Tax=Nocardia sp. NRRL S-836 TaxID=1519492 RepID=UPI000A752971|nr:5'-methylthioadenosine/S-adenosylhomocysteine nucleosidase [Nocardia sp. NRRL S-836]